MSQDFTPPPVDPLQYATPLLPASSARPTAVTVIAILAIIFGALGILASLCAVPQMLGINLLPTPNPVLQGIANDPVLRFSSICTHILNLALAIIQLAAGIGSLSLKPASRRWLLRYAVAEMVFIVINLAMYMTITGPRIQAITDQAGAGNPTLNTPQLKQVMQYSRYSGYCFAILFQIWPLSILYYMSRPEVMDAFGRRSEGSALPPMGP